jgi:hypothetical protein
LVGFSDEELRILLADHALGGEDDAGEDEIPETPVNPVSRPDDLWVIGRHRLICGDCRDAATVARVLEGASMNVAITSPPYASQREYDQASGFTPIPMLAATKAPGNAVTVTIIAFQPVGCYRVTQKELEIMSSGTQLGPMDREPRKF